MAQFVLARKSAIINLENVASVVHDASGFESVSGHTKSVTIYLVGGQRVVVMESDPDYEQWLAFMASQSTIGDRVAQQKLAQAKQIAADDFDPFLDELPHDLFSVFRSLPGHEQMSLQLQSDGRGDIRLDGEVVAFWVDPADGISRMENYRKELAMGANEE